MFYLAGWNILFCCSNRGRHVEVPGAGRHTIARGAANDDPAGQEVGHRLLLLPGLYTKMMHHIMKIKIE